MTPEDDIELWDLAWDEGNHANIEGISVENAFATGASWGAGWMAAIIGMAEAIRSHLCPSCLGPDGRRCQCENDE